MDLNGVNLIKTKVWILQNSSLKATLFYVDNFHLIEDGNI